MNSQGIKSIFNLLIFSFLIINSFGKNIDSSSTIKTEDTTPAIQNQNETISSTNSSNIEPAGQKFVTNSTELNEQTKNETLVTKSIIESNNTTNVGVDETTIVLNTKSIELDSTTEAESITTKLPTTDKPTTTPEPTPSLKTTSTTTTKKHAPAIITTTHEAHKKSSGITASGFFLGFFVAFLLVFIAFMALRFYQKRNNIPYGVL